MTNQQPKPINREEVIQSINILLNQAYDSTLEEILAYLKQIDAIEDEEDIQAIKEIREDIRTNGTIPWEEINRDINKDVA
jgi:DNA-binding protein H-NS